VKYKKYLKIERKKQIYDLSINVNTNTLKYNWDNKINNINMMVKIKSVIYEYINNKKINLLHIIITSFVIKW